jgi:hypothetical protein
MAQPNIPEGYATEMPTTGGAWWMICNENDYERSPIEIRMDDGILYADDADLGVYPLEYYHDNLTDIRWMKA